jgi:hypothetical protein
VRAHGRLDLASTFADSRPRAATLIYAYLGSPNTLIDGKARHLVAHSTIHFDRWVRGLPICRRCPLRTGALSRHYSAKNDGAVGTVLFLNSLLGEESPTSGDQQHISVHARLGT